MRFRPHDSDRRTRRRPPPNYFARSVQVRLLMLVAMFMTVLLLMGEARDPENWEWMWSGDAETVDADTQVDTRLRKSGASGGSTGNVRAASLWTAGSAAPGASRDDGLHQIRSDGWARVSRLLVQTQRWALDRVLKSARGGAPLDADQQVTFDDTLDVLEEGWDTYLRRTREIVAADASLDDAARRRWSELLDVVGTDWHRRWKVALQAPLEDRVWTELQRAWLAEIQGLLDEIAIGAVQDDTVLGPDDQHAWFRLLEILAETPASELARRSEAARSFLQLYRQPEQYRGRLVTIRGVARLVYRLEAPPNAYGIRTYYVFWIKPAGGQRSPFVVYALELPEGFAQVADVAGDERHEIHEDVTVTGYFFKRYVYRARDGVNTAPLLLAKVPTWAAPVVVQRRVPGAGVLLFSFAVVAALGVLLAWLLVRSGRSPPVDVFAKAAEQHGFQDLELAPGVEEGLQRMSERARERE